MSAGWVNLIVLAAILLIVVSAVTVFYPAATQWRRTKEGRTGQAAQSLLPRGQPKTGDMFLYTSTRSSILILE